MSLKVSSTAFSNFVNEKSGLRQQHGLHERVTAQEIRESGEVSSRSGHNIDIRNMGQADLGRMLFQISMNREAAELERRREVERRADEERREARRRREVQRKADEERREARRRREVQRKADEELREARRRREVQRKADAELPIREARRRREVQRKADEEERRRNLEYLSVPPPTATREARRRREVQRRADNEAAELEQREEVERIANEQEAAELESVLDEIQMRREIERLAYEENRLAPTCQNGHAMILSTFSGHTGSTDYRSGHSCDGCSRSGSRTTERWFCFDCGIDYCRQCGDQMAARQEKRRRARLKAEADLEAANASLAAMSLGLDCPKCFYKLEPFRWDWDPGWQSGGTCDGCGVETYDGQMMMHCHRCEEGLCASCQ